MVKPFRSYLVQNVVAVQIITGDSSDYKECSFLTGKFASGEVLPAIDFDYRQGEWVKVLYESELHIGLILDVNKSDKLICVKCLVPSQGNHWKLESERNSVCYSECDVLGQPDNDPTMDRRGGLYKL